MIYIWEFTFKSFSSLFLASLCISSNTIYGILRDEGGVLFMVGQLSVRCCE